MTNDELTTFRAALGVTQSEMAIRIDTPLATVIKWETPARVSPFPEEYQSVLREIEHENATLVKNVVNVICNKISASELEEVALPYCIEKNKLSLKARYVKFNNIVRSVYAVLRYTYPNLAINLINIAKDEDYLSKIDADVLEAFGVGRESNG
jgi:hypothetical protein